MHIVAFDYGTKKIGVAVGQTETCTSSPLQIIYNDHDKTNWNEISILIDEWNPELILVGKPLNMDDTQRQIIKKVEKFSEKRKKLKQTIMNKKLSFEERFKAQQKLSKLPRNSAKTRVMNRCQITGRPHGVYRKLKISRIALRKLGLEGKIPGMVKSSW